MARYSIEVTRALTEFAAGDDYFLLLDPGPTHQALLELERSEVARITRIGFGGQISRYRERRPAPFVSLLEAALIGVQLRRVALDLIHWMGQPPPFVFPGVAAVATIHHVNEYDPTFRLPDLTDRIRTWQYRHYRAMRAVICVSEATRRAALAELRLHEDRCFSIPPPVAPLETIESYSTGIIERARATSFLLHVGVLTQQKNPTVLLQSFALLLPRRPDLELWCVGPYQVNSGAAANVIRLAESLRIRHRVRIVGEVSDENLAQLYRDCLAVVFPSFIEGFGYPAVEAISNHARCVLADIPALHEAAGELASYADPSDPAAFAAAIGRILDSKQASPRADLSWVIAADAWVKRFSHAEVARRLSEVYRSAARNPM